MESHQLDMTKAQWSRIAEQRDRIVEDVNTIYVLDRLIQDGVISDENRQKIESGSTSQERSRCLLDLLPLTQGAFFSFVTALKMERYDHIADELVHNSGDDHTVTEKRPGKNKICRQRPKKCKKGPFQQMMLDLRLLYDGTDISACNDAGLSLYQPPSLYLHHEFARHDRSNLQIIEPRQKLRKGHGIEVDKLFQKTEDEHSACDIHHVLLVGRPAIGKTCFLRKSCQDWANKELWPNTFDCVFIFQLREFNQDDIIKKGISLRKLLMERHGPEKLDEDVVWSQLKPNRCLIIFDGLDEFKGFEDLPPKDPPIYSSCEARMRLPFLLWNLLKGNIFKGCYVICSSRPRASALPLLQDLFHRNVDLHGFDETQVVSYFQLFLKKQNLSSIQCQEMVRHSVNLLSICYIPAMCHCMAEIITNNFEQSSDWRQNPETWTETMLVAIMYLLHQHHPKFVQQNHELLELDNILLHFNEPLSKLAELALWCMHNDPMKIIFTSQDLHLTDLEVNQDMVDMGVLHSLRLVYQGLFKTVVDNYSFMHLIFMEFFAALGLALDPLKSKEIFMKTNGEYEMINLFLVGFLGNENCRSLVQKVFNRPPEWEDDANTIVRTFFRERYKQLEVVKPTDFAVLILMLYEGKLGTDADDLLAFKVSKDNSNVGLDLHETLLTASDCVSLKYFLDHLSTIPSSIDLDGNPIGDSGLKKLCGTPVCLTSTEQLSLRNTSLTKDGIMSLVQIMSTSEVKELIVSGNLIGDEGLAHICDVLAYCGLKTLVAEDIGLGFNGIKMLTNTIKTSALSDIDLSYNQLNKEGIQLISGMLADHPLQSLKLIGCNLRDGGLETLCHNLPASRLQKLNVATNSIGRKGLHHLCDAMPRSRLIELALNNNDIQGSDLKMLKHSLKNSRLETLVLANNKIDDEGARYLAQALEYCFITLLVLYDNKDIGDRGAEFFGNALPQSRIRVMSLLGTCITRIGAAKLAIGAANADTLHYISVSEEVGTYEANVRENLQRTSKSKLRFYKE